MGFWDWIAPGSGDSKCCKKCSYFSEHNDYDRFICTALDKEIRYDSYDEKENIKKNCLCNTKEGLSGDYFRWK